MKSSSGKKYKSLSRFLENTIHVHYMLYTLYCTAECIAMHMTGLDLNSSDIYKCLAVVYLLNYAKGNLICVFKETLPNFARTLLYYWSLLIYAWACVKNMSIEYLNLLQNT